MNEDLLIESEKLCKELIEIRRSLQQTFHSLHTNCTSAYLQLAKIAIYRHCYDEAEIYLDKATQEEKIIDSDLLLYDIDYVKAELAIAQNNLEGAIHWMSSALDKISIYFEDTHRSTTDLRLKLAELYEKNGNQELAIKQYSIVSNTLQALPYHHDTYLLIQNRLKILNETVG